MTGNGIPRGVHFAAWLCKEANRLAHCSHTDHDALAKFIVGNVEAWAEGEVNSPTPEDCESEQAFCAFVREQTGCEHCAAEAKQVWERYLRAHPQRMH